MKIFSTLLILIFSIVAQGQIDTSKIKISKINYYKYSFKERECFTDNDSLISESDTTNKDSVISQIQQTSYPKFKSLDKKLEKFLNDSINYFFEINELNSTSKELSWSFTCMYDKPDESSQNFSLNFINSRYLSITILDDWEAGEGGNGASHEKSALTFDLKKRKILLVKDIIEEKFDSLIYNQIISQIGASYDKEIVDNLNLNNFTSTLYFPAAIKNDRIIIYWPLSFGSKGADEEISILFNKYPFIFRKKFIKSVHHK